MSEGRAGGRPKNAVAVVGMACRVPGAADLEAFWRNLRAGVESVHRFSAEELAAAGVDAATLASGAYVRARGVLDGIDHFDAPFFGFSRREAEILDPQQRLFLENAWHALEHAGLDPTTFEGRVGCFAGIGLNTYLLRNLLSRPELVEALGGFQVVLGNDKDFVPTRAAYLLDLRGPAVAINTACSSSLVAVHLACQSLLLHQCDAILAGGVSIESGQDQGYWHQEGGVLSPDGRCRPFDAAARGTIEASGVGLVVLKRLEDALDAGDQIHAVLLGSAINNDGAAKASFTAPSPDGQAEVIAEALAIAGIDPGTVGYVEAHGTGTMLGDPIEVEALTRAFRLGTAERGYCGLGSVKSNFGHLDTAAGVVGLIKAILALERGEIPPSLHFERPNPHLELEKSPFFVADRLRPWARIPGRPRRAGVSSFGIGGTNAHVLLEEAPAARPAAPSRDWQVLTLSARSPEALEAQRARLADALASAPELPLALADTAFTLARGRRRLPWRWAVAVPSAATPAAVAEALRRPAAGRRALDGPAVFLLPGQGSQRPGMGRDLYAAEPVFRAAFDAVAERIAEAAGWDPRERVLAADPADAAAAAWLERTENAQPALFALEVALAALWRSWGVEPAALLGHSIGELTAAHLAGVFSLDDAVMAVIGRGRLLQAMAPGAMLAVPLAAADVEKRLAGTLLEVATVNGRKRTVVAGPSDAIDTLAAALEADGVTTRRLRTSHAFHSATVDAVADELEALFACLDLRAPRIPLLSNVGGGWLSDADATDPAYWARQARTAVRFDQDLATLLADVPGILLEVGPGSALATLVREHPAFGDGHAVHSSLPAGGADEQASIAATLAAAVADGLAPDFGRYFAGERRQKVALPLYPFEHQSYWIAPAARAKSPQPVAASAETEVVAQAQAPLRLPPRQALAALWRELLGAEAGREADFFEAGGHSLLGTVLVSRLRRDLGLELDLETLFKHPSFDALATFLERAAGMPEAPPVAAAAKVVDAADPITRRAPGEPAQASFAQERMWFVDQLTPGDAFYNLAAGLMLSGDLDAAALEAALGDLAARHPALRTRFVPSATGPRPEVDVEAPALEQVDLSASLDAKTEADTWARQWATRPFDLARGPLWRAALLQLEAGRHLLAVALHHTIADGWSVGLLSRDLADFYSRRCGATSIQAPATPPIDYADFAAWQRHSFAGAERQRLIDHWRHHLAGAEPLLELPMARAAARRAAGGGRPGGLVAVDLDAAAGQALRARARELGATPFMLLFAAWALLLGRFARRREVVVGTPIAGRNRAETEELVGCFVNLLPLRVDLGAATFAGLVADVKRVALDGFAHPEAPFESLVDALGVDRGARHAPIVQAIFTLQNAPAAEGRFAGLEAEPRRFELGQAGFDLSLLFEPAASGGFAGELRYDALLYPAADMERLAAAYGLLLAAALDDPSRAPSALPLLAAREREALIEIGRARRAPVFAPLLLDRFETMAAAAPTATAARCGDDVATYGELAGRVHRLARALRRRGVRPADRVGLCMERSIELIEALLAILTVGAAYVPLDPINPSTRLLELAADAGLKLLVSAGAPAIDLYAAAARGTAPELLQLDLPSTRAAIDAEDASPFPPAELPSAELPAYVIYTSGSTGRPKGVVITHGQMARLFTAAEEHFDFGPADVWTFFHSYAFDFSVWELWGALAYGGRLIVVPLEVGREGERFHHLLRDEGVTVLNQTPSAFRQLDEVDARLGGALSLRYVVFGGEALDPSALAGWWRRHGDEAPALINMYGITETTVHVTFRRLRQDAGQDGVASPIGAPLADLGLFVLDGRLEPVPLGVAGELLVAGAGLADGYLGRPALTAARFVPNPFGGPGERLYRSGDLARRVGQEIDYLGRIDHQIKLRGYRIELGEIHAALAASPGVRDAVVLLRGEGAAARLVAWVVPTADGACDADALRADLRRRLPEYMAPSAIVLLGALPLTVNGKLDQRALPEPQEARAAKSRRPENEWQRSLAAVWEELLAVEDVGLDDEFFALGGHSLVATRLATRVRDVFGVELPVRTIFDAPTLEAQAAWLASARGAARAAVLVGDGAPPLVRLADELAPALSYGQERLWFLDRLASQPTRTAYVVPAAIRMVGPLDAPRLRGAFAALVARHDALRTVVADVDGSPRARRLTPAEATPAWRQRDLSQTPEEETEATRERALARLVAEPFELGEGPLLRLELLRLPPDPSGAEVHALHVALHHIAADGWSLGVLVRELSRLYAGAALTPLPIAYSDFAAWQRAWLAGPERERQLAFWRERLRGAAPVLDLASDRPRPAQRSLQGGTARVEIEPALADALRALGRSVGASPFMVLSAAFALLLARYSGQRDLQIGVPVANRNRGELEGLLGFFANTLVLRFDLATPASFRELLAAVRRDVLDAFDHQDLPFEVLVEALDPPRTLAHSPLFQVMLAFQNAADGRLELPGLELELLEVPSPRTKFDLSLSIEEHDDGGWRGDLVYAMDLWDAPSIGRFLDHWRELLRSAAATPDEALALLGMLLPGEAEALGERASNARPFDLETPLIRALEAQAATCADAPAVFDGDEALSHRRLHAEAAALARELRRRGIGPESIVGLHLETSSDLLIAILATLKAGAAYLPLDPHYPEPRLRHMVEDSGAALVLGQSAFADGLAPASLETLGIDRLDVDRWRAAALATLDMGPVIDSLPGALLPTHPAYLLYTSGSTGKPKGVVIEQRGLANYVAWIGEIFAAAGVRHLPWVTTLAFDASLKQVFGPLAMGGAVDVVRRADATSPERLLPHLAAAGTGLSCVPSLWEVLLEAIEAGQVPPPPGLKVLMLGGEALTPRLVRRSLDAVPGLRVMNFYGPTETTATSIQGALAGDTRVVLGRPVANNEIRVLDAAGRPAAINVPGELHIGGAGVARGYLGRPALTAERFVPDPYGAPGSRHYRTGDRGRLLADGAFEFLGRVDRQTKVRGQRVEPGEVEAALAEDAAIARAWVSVADGRLIAHVLAASQAGDLGPSFLEGVRGRLREKVPEHLVPSRWAVVERFPLLPNGKLDVAALPPARELGVERSAGGPRSAAEERVEAVWRDLLGAGDGTLGLDDSFFDVGGHSLLVVRLQSRLRRDLSLELELVELFRHPTIRRQAALLDGSGDEAAAPSAASVAAERAAARRSLVAEGGERRRQRRGRET
jgi:amino acid adenylation domain-containing protein